MLEVDGIPLDVGNRALGGFFPEGKSVSSDRVGHAAPLLVDIDGDGKRDLILGTYAGLFRFYKNVSTDDSPVFSKEFTWLRAGDELAKVRIFCCVASGPQIVDLDGDGIPDLLAGSYDPGAVYWFRGVGNSQFAQRQMLTDEVGIPIFTALDQLGRQKTRTRSLMSNVAAVDWDNDGLPDLVIGNLWGQLFVRLNRGMDSAGYTPSSKQPTFSTFAKQIEILIDGNVAIPEGHAAPAIADWDGDGLWDILVGTDAGNVYFLKNTGTLGHPKFLTRQEIIPPGWGHYQWVETGTRPVRGSKSQIHVVDYNQDGKLDILVGDWVLAMTPRTGLTADEDQKMRSILAELQTLDERMHYNGSKRRESWPSYKSDTTRLRQAQWLIKQLEPYVEPGRYHGRVWVFLNNGTSPIPSLPSPKTTPATSVPQADADGPVTTVLAPNPATAKCGDTVTVTLKVDIASPWYVYRSPGATGQSPMELSLILPDGLEPVGDWVWPEPEVRFDEGEVQLYTGSHVFTRRIRVVQARGTVPVKGTLTYQACNEEVCLPRDTLALSAVLTIVE